MTISKELQNLKMLLETYIRFDKPRNPILKNLDFFDEHLSDLDNLRESAVITRSDIKSILIRFLDKELTAKEVENWAFNLWKQEGVIFEAEYEDMIDTIFNVLNWGEFSKEEIQIMLDSIETGEYIPPADR